MKNHFQVKHPDELLKKDLSGINKLNNNLAVWITEKVGTVWTGYLFGLLSLFSLPAILKLVFPRLSIFPHWLISASLIALIAWISQNFLQLVLLPIIMVGQNVIQNQNDRKAEVDHRTLTYLANLQDEQMVELKAITKILETLKKAEKK